MLSPPRPGALPLAFRGFIEDRQPFGRGERLSPTASDDPDSVALDDPLDLVARPNPEAVSDCLRNGDLQLTGNLGHILTLSRIRALIKHGMVRVSPRGSLTTGELDTHADGFDRN